MCPFIPFITPSIPIHQQKVSYVSPTPRKSKNGILILSPTFSSSPKIDPMFLFVATDSDVEPSEFEYE